MKNRLPLIFGFFFVAVVSLLLLFLLYRHQFNSLIYSNEDVRRTNDVINQIQKIQSGLVELENIEREFLLSRKDTAQTLNLIKSKSVQIHSLVENLQELTRSNKVQKQTLIKINDDISKRMLLLEKSIVVAMEKNEPLSDIYNERGSAIMQDFNRLIIQMENEEFKLLQRLEADKKHSENITPSYVELIIGISLFVLLVSFVMMVREVRKSKRYERDLEIQLVELNANKLELEQIAFVASHHLKEPIRKIRTFNNRLILAGGKPTIDTNTLARRIDKLGERMQELIDDLVQYTMIAHVKDKATTIDLNQCIKKVVAELNEEIKQHQAILTVNELPSIKGYAGQLKILFSHLIENALKYSSPDRIPHITISYEDAGHRPLIKGNGSEIYNDYVKISIADNGIGFDNEFAEKIFLMFQRLHHQDSQFSGKGIGLAICRRIMVNHIGKIEAVGQQDIGATFNLYFPV